MRKFLLIGSMVMALLATQFAQAEPTYKRYEQTGDPVLVCPLHSTRSSSQGVCVDVPAGSQIADIYVTDDSGNFGTAFKYTFLNAAGLPAYVDPVGMVYGLLGYGVRCGQVYGAYVPSGAVMLRVELVRASPYDPSCSTGTSGQVTVLF